MLKFKEYLEESTTTEHPIGKMHELLNKSQLKTLRKHPDFKTYIDGGQGHSIHFLARHAHTGQPSSVVHRFMVLNAANPNHRMHVSLGNRGKYYWHEIHKRDDKDENTWHHIKSGTIDK